MLRIIIASLLAVWTSGCSGSDDPAVVIVGGPQLTVAEGGALEASVTIEPAVSADLSATQFEVVLDPQLQNRFAQLAVVAGAAGLPVLRAVPYCDIVTEGSAIFDVEVRAQLSTTVAPAQVAIQVTAEAAGSCLPRVTLWQDVGDRCVTVGTPLAPARALPLPRGTAQTLCARVESLDPDNEPLWATVTTDAPSTLIAELPKAENVADARLIIDVLPNAHVVGRFGVDINVFRENPDGADALVEPTLVEATQFTLGERGDWAVELISTDSAQLAVDEFNVVSIPFRVWHFSDRPEEETCVRAERFPSAPSPFDRGKPFLRLYAPSGAAVDPGLLTPCEVGTFTLRVSPPIDSRPTEGVRIEVRQPGEPVTAPAAFHRDLSIDVTSRAEELKCFDVDAPNPPPPLVVCADLDASDPTPEVLIRTASDSRRACVFRGTAGRFDPSPLTWVGTPSPPAGVIAFKWNSGTGTRNLMLGEFGSGPGRQLAELSIDSSAATAEWIAGPGLIALPDNVQLTSVVPAAENVGEATTHFMFAQARAGSWSIRIDCISTAAGCASYEVTDVAPLAAVDDARVGLTDLNGDGVSDVVFLGARDDGGGRRSLIVVAVAPDWSSPTASCSSTATCVSFAEQPITGTVGPSVSVPVPGASFERLYAITGDAGFDASLLDITGSTGYFTSPPSVPGVSLITPGPALGVTSTDDKLVASLASGVWSFDSSASPPSWRLVDPVLQEDAAAGVIPVTPAGYGRGLASCLVSAAQPAAFAFSSSNTSVRFTELNVVVAEP